MGRERAKRAGGGQALLNRGGGGSTHDLRDYEGILVAAHWRYESIGKHSEKQQRPRILVPGGRILRVQEHGRRCST